MLIRIFKNCGGKNVDGNARNSGKNVFTMDGSRQFLLVGSVPPMVFTLEGGAFVESEGKLDRICHVTIYGSGGQWRVCRTAHYHSAFVWTVLYTAH